MLYMFQAVSPPIIRSSKVVHTAGAQKLYAQHRVYAKLAVAAWHIPNAVCTIFELLMMGGETA